MQKPNLETIEQVWTDLTLVFKDADKSDVQVNMLPEEVHTYLYVVTNLITQYTVYVASNLTHSEPWVLEKFDEYKSVIYALDKASDLNESYTLTTEQVKLQMMFLDELVVKILPVAAAIDPIGMLQTLAEHPDLFKDSDE